MSDFYIVFYGSETSHFGSLTKQNIVMVNQVVAAGATSAI